MTKGKRMPSKRLIPDFSYADRAGLGRACVRLLALLSETRPLRDAAWVVRWSPGSAPRIDGLVLALDAASERSGFWIWVDEHSILLFDAGAGRGLRDALDGWIAGVPSANRPEVFTLDAVDDDGLVLSAVASTPSVSPPPPTPSLPPKPEKLVLADPERTFVPVWDLEADAAFCYVCRSHWIGRDGSTITEQMLDDYSVSPEMLLAVDLEGAEVVTTTLLDLLDVYGTANLAVPVHASMLCRVGERWSAEMWGFVLPVLDQVTFEILLGGGDDGPGPLAEAVAALAEFGRPLFLRTNPDPDLVARCGAEAFTAIGFDGAYHRDAVQDRDGLARFADAVRAVGSLPYVLGLSSIEETLNAVNSGFGLIGSDLISAPLHPEPGGAANDDPAALLRSLIASRSSGRIGG